MTTQNAIAWDGLFGEIPPENMVELLSKIYWEQTEYKLENQEKITPDDATCLYSLRQIIKIISRMEKQNYDS